MAIGMVVVETYRQGKLVQRYREYRNGKAYQALGKVEWESHYKGQALQRFRMEGRVCQIGKEQQHRL